MNTLSTHLVADFGPHRGRMGGGSHPGLIILCIVAAALIGFGIFSLLRNRRHPLPLAAPPQGHNPGASISTAEAILAERFARGEVPVEEFLTARAALRGELVPTAPAPPAEA